MSSYLVVLFNLILYLSVFLINCNCYTIISNQNENENLNLELNKRPIIGILTQEVSQFINRKYPNHTYKSYIASSYVKFVESAGGRVVPIWIGQPKEYYENLLKNVNGVLLPGGATYFNNTNGYAIAGDHIYDIAKKLNENGIYFPVWGTCLGYELLLYLTAEVEPRIYCNSTNQPLPLKFVEDYEKSRLFTDASSETINILAKENVTANFHLYCITKETLNQTGLANDWKITSLGYDWNNVEFIASIEHIKYPFYGVQFHPEKNNYEFGTKLNIPHTENAIKIGQYFANFFLNESRKNLNKFSKKNDENNYLIYNYNPLFTGRKGSAFEQQYLFEQNNNLNLTNEDLKENSIPTYSAVLIQP